MKKLYKAETNSMVVYVVEDWETDLAICVDWDLSQEEEAELIKAFEAGTLDETANGGEWNTPETVYAGTFNKVVLA